MNVRNIDKAETNIGLLGGTFDPIHLGHLIIAEEVRQRVGLEEVIFVPAGQPWLKGDRIVTAGEHRLEMVRLAIGSNPYFKLSTIELERSGPSYSVDTVLALKDELGLARLYFIVGLDALAELPFWKDPARLVELCQIVAVKRPGYSDADLEPLEGAIPGASARIVRAEAPLIDISASDIRRRVAQGLSIRYLVPEAVERYILEHRLYKEVSD